MDLSINGIRLIGNRCGVGRYIEYLLRHWAHMAHPFDRIYLYTPGPLEESIVIPKYVEHKIIPSSLRGGYWEQVILPLYLQKSDILFCPSYRVPLAARNKTVVTHLGSYEALPWAFPWIQRLKNERLYRLSAKKADFVITVSESSKSDIMRYYGIPAEKIKVIYLGVDSTFRPLNEAQALRKTRERYFGSDRPYLLFVGKLSKRRNIPQLIAAYAKVKKERDLPHGLLLLGPDPIGQNVAQLARDFNVSDSVVHHEFASHAQLVYIYNAADLFIYPSSYEGFGLPVLEAMACGVPAIALRNSAFLEFARDAAYLVKDSSVDELSDAITTVLFSKGVREQMCLDGIKRSKDFGWETIARQTMDVLADVAQRSAC